MNVDANANIPSDTGSSNVAFANPIGTLREEK